MLSANVGIIQIMVHHLSSAGTPARVCACVACSPSGEESPIVFYSLLLFNTVVVNRAKNACLTFSSTTLI